MADAGPRKVGGKRGPLLAAAATANRSRRLRDDVSARTWRPVSGSMSVSSPRSGSSDSRGSRISTAMTSCRRAAVASATRPVARTAEVRHEDDQPARLADAPDELERLRRRRGSGDLARDRPRSAVERPRAAAAGPCVPPPEAAGGRPGRRTSRRRRGCRAVPSGVRPPAQRPRRRPPCDGPRCRTSSTARGRAAPTRSPPAPGRAPERG